MYLAFWDVVFVSTEYCICDDLVCCLNVGDGLEMKSSISLVNSVQFALR